MTNKKKITLHDVAERSGVSISTVSMIVNQKSDVTFSADTIKKVMDAVKTTGYIIKQTPSAQHTIKEPGKLSKIIAVFCPNITNPYYSTIVQSIEHTAHLCNYRVFTFNTFRDPSLEKQMLKDVVKMQVSGIIFAMMPSAPEFVEQLGDSIPVVVIGDKDSSIRLDTIETSNYIAGVLIAEHLLELGHRHAAFISTTLERPNTMRTRRLQGIQDTFKKASPECTVSVYEKKIIPTYERQNIFLEHSIGFELCDQCLHSPEAARITALIGVNDVIAYGVADAALKAGYEIPKDFSICGFDNNFPSRLISVSLTTIEHFMQEKGSDAFQMLYKKIGKEPSSSDNAERITRIEYHPKLIVRDSTNRAPIRK